MNAQIPIERGAETVIKAKPIQTKSDDDIKSVDVDRRPCRFDDEVPDDMVLFKKYTKQACLFECLYKYRYKRATGQMSSYKNRTRQKSMDI